MSRLAINPLPWVLDETGFHLDVPSLRTAFAAVTAEGFRAVQADVPPELDVAGYRDLLAGFGLSPAPGYYGPAMHDPALRADAVEGARRHGATQAALGLDRSFVAAGIVPERMAAPAVGAGDPAALPAVIDTLGAVAEAMTAEGVRPMLHPHVATAIETEAEARAALDGIDAGILGFGPDTGHLAWVGADVVALIAEYRDRVGGVHLKDVDDAARTTALGTGAEWRTATRSLHVWTEPGRGFVDLDGVLALFADAPESPWYVIEVDVPNAPTPEESTALSAAWARSRPALAGGLA